MTSILLTLLLMQGAAAPPANLDAAEKTAAVANLRKEIEARYVEIDLSKKISSALEAWVKTDDYASAATGPVFADRVNAVLKANVTDAHFRFRFAPNGFPKRQAAGEPSPEEEKRYEREMRFSNAAFEKVERLRGNVGYLKFNMFASPAEMKRPLEGAMKFLENCDAFIIDLRQNGGGDPAGVQLFCSYFFEPKPVHLNSIWFREGEKLTKEEFWTLEKVEGARFPKAPLFVLTSKRTGSGAEECSYNFQQLKRGTIIGEPTWGGANPGGMVRLSDHFACFIPVGRAENPYSKTNWEAVGVKPDVAHDPATSLKVGHVMALKGMIDKAPSAEEKADLENILRQVEAEN